MTETAEVRVPVAWAELARSDGVNIGQEVRRRRKWVWLRMTGYQILEAIDWGQKATRERRVKRGNDTVAVLMRVDPKNIRSLPGPDGSQLRVERPWPTAKFIVARKGGGRPDATLYHAGPDTPEGRKPFYWVWGEVNEFMKWHALGIDLVEALDGAAEWRER